MSKSTRRNLANFFVLAMFSIAVVPTLINAEQWQLMNYVMAVALGGGVVWVVADLVRSANGSLR
ncbi:hypothetical protein [Saccharopolyspora gloriosae]|uniref:hypothetical protein n=1 Tax=Saccharopolyspora gloriosae TaxID=455344 RepID=UPI001FB60C7B|nr:hypothetical protein [Saccharopolyspora gloriosae]